MHKKILAVMLVLVFAAVAYAVNKGPEEFKIEAKMGTVTFKHHEHQKRIGDQKCNKCHHTAKADGSDAKKCSECHMAKKSQKDGKDVPSAKDAFHKTCKDCHKAEKKGPTKCKECHKK